VRNLSKATMAERNSLNHNEKRSNFFQNDGKRRNAHYRRS
jgi:hypothetical protein